MDEDEGPHEDLNEHEMSEKASHSDEGQQEFDECRNVVIKSVQMTTIPKASKMN